MRSKNVNAVKVSGGGASGLIPAQIVLPYRFERAAPPFEGNDIKFPESLARFWIGRLTKTGGRVFDPFAGLGTTLFVAEEMKRIPYGVEADERRHGWVAGQLTHWNNLVYGDSGQLETYAFPRMDLCLSSPPFMARSHRWNPLYGGNPAKAGYDRYLRWLGVIYKKAEDVMKKGAYVIVQVDNIPGRTFTPLIRDMGTVLEKSFRPVGETLILWEKGRAEYPHTHCLVFRKE